MKTITVLILCLMILSGCSKPAPEVQLAIDTQAKLGEGALWDYQNNRLFWVDIENGNLFIYTPENGKNKKIELGQKVGTVVPTTDKNVLVALEDGIYYLDIENEIMGLKVNPEPAEKNNRYNDGKCDPQGRLWVGSMGTKDGAPNASLFQINSDFSFHVRIDPVSTSNGIVWSPDGTKMYYIDTPTQKVVQYDFDSVSGDLSNPKNAIVIADNLGHPDGSTMDEEGMIWIGMWGGYAVTRWNPETGELLDRIEVPAKNVTSCAFGGSELDTLYITTASVGMKESEINEYPDAGKLFKVVPGVKGVKANYFKF